MRQLTIAFDSIEAEERATREAIAGRLKMLEAAAINCRIAWDEVGGRVMRALGHLCGSRRQQSLGITGLRWAGPVSELAEDHMVGASVARVRAVLRRLEELGIVSKQVHHNWRGQDDGVLITLEMGAIQRLAKVGRMVSFYGSENTTKECRNHPPDHPVDHPPNHLLDYPVDYPANYPVDHLVHLEPTLYSVLPSIPKDPPPPKSNANSDDRKQDRAAADFGKPLAADAATESIDDEAEIATELKSAGIDRTRPLAKEFRGRSAEVREAVATYRANRSKLRTPGAIVDFLRSGAWPVEGVRSLDEIQRQRERIAIERRERDAERLRIDHARNKPPGGFSDDERAELRKAGILV
jgi:hypothetical protein